MQKIFFTLLIIWVLFRIFGSRTVRHIFTVNVNKPNEEKKSYDKSSEGKVKVDYIPPKNKGERKDGEYVDYEEVK